MTRAREGKKRSWIAEYFRILSEMIRTPGRFFATIAEEKDWVRPTGILLISAIFFSVASAIMAMPGNSGASMAIGFANAIGMVWINASFGYLVMRFTRTETVSFFRFYAVYAYAAGVILTLSWMPCMVVIAECWRWWLIGCGLTRACGFSVKSSIVIILFSWVIVLLLFWFLLSLTAAGSIKSPV